MFGGGGACPSACFGFENTELIGLIQFLSVFVQYVADVARLKLAAEWLPFPFTIPEVPGPHHDLKVGHPDQPSPQFSSAALC
jgi:hypothetical protein